MALLIANTLLAIAVLAGTGLALWHLRATEPTQRPPSFIGLSHGAVGAAGFVALLLALQGPPRGVAEGAGQFGILAAVLLGLALLAGTALWLLHRGMAVTIAVHAGLAICGYVLLLAWSSFG